MPSPEHNTTPVTAANVAHDVADAVINDLRSAELLETVVSAIKARGIYTGIQRVLNDPTVELNGFDPAVLEEDIVEADAQITVAIADAVERGAIVSESAFRHSFGLLGNN